jgi:hypothetical protein
MSPLTARRLVWVFGVLHLVCAPVLIFLAGYLALSPNVRDGWVALAWLVPASVYFFWLGYRACASPSARVVGQICNTVALVVAAPFVAFVEYTGWPKESARVMLPSAFLVSVCFWLMTFGGRYFCRRLFPVERQQ